MSLTAAQALLDLPQESAVGDWLAREDVKRALIWDVLGLEVLRWNEIAARVPAMLGQVVCEDLPGGQTALNYKGRTLTAALLGGRLDGLVVIHTLSCLVKDDAELRLCIDTREADEVAFLPLSPGGWNRLEAKYGVDAVEHRFLAIPPQFQLFIRTAFTQDPRVERARRLQPPEPKHPAKIAAARIVQDFRQRLHRLVPDPHLEYTVGYLPTPNLVVTIGVKTDQQLDALANKLELRRSLEQQVAADCAAENIHFFGFHFFSAEMLQRDYSGDYWEWFKQRPRAALTPPPKISPSSPPQPPSRPMVAAAEPGKVAVRCAHCGHAFHAAPRLTLLRFRSFVCPACGLPFKRGLGLKLRLCCWVLLAVTTWLWARYPNDAFFLALLLFSGMVLADLFQLSKRP